MAPSKNINTALAQKTARLQLRLAPLVPLPHGGPPHPAFPSTLAAYHLLTEDELDSIAHYYHQSTPGPWMHAYPACMNWDKDFLARSPPPSPGRRAQDDPTGDAWLAELLDTVRAAATQAVDAKAPAVESYASLTRVQRVRIKRRKLGKFIGLRDNDTPIEEIQGRIQASLDRALKRSRDELRRSEWPPKGS